MLTKISLRDPFGTDTPIISGRHLVIRHERRILKRIAAEGDTDSTDDNEGSESDRKQLPELKSGEEQIKSFFQPSLSAGTYSIKVEQTVKRTEDDQLKLKSNHIFTVDAPQISLPSGSIHSTYPPQGHSDTVDILPHVVLNDPHLPWERRASIKDEGDAQRNQVPWLALLVFTQDELRVPADDLARYFNERKQNAMTLTIHATTSELGKWEKAKSIVTPLTNIGIADASNMDVIMLQPDLFKAFVTIYQPGSVKPKEDQKKADVSRYRFLAHVRNINTEGMPEAGTQDDRLFSVVVSHRVGPLTTTQPTPMVAHLVSIEGVEQMDMKITSNYVTLCSLHSWAYTSLPASSLTPFDLFQHIGQTLDLLRTPDSLISALGMDEVSQRIATRLRDGYTLTKYRSRTGDITAAITRGPLTPRMVPHLKNDDWKAVSNSGDNLQILDEKVGLMDISYSAAWNLGKAMAVADQKFASALGRLRSVIFDKTMDMSKAEMLRKKGAYMSKEDVLRSLPQLAENLAGLRVKTHRHQQHHHHHHHAFSHRWLRQPHKPIDLSLRNEAVRDKFANHVRSVTRELARSLNDGGGKQGDLYDGHNIPLSSDWAVVIDWVLDRMYLIDIPAHILIPDPAHLPQESLRFFHIDANWVDAFIDGALSVANYAGSDIVRGNIKKQINEYLEFKHEILQKRPQIPTFGFLMRSKLVTLFPDLKVAANQPANESDAPILHLGNIDEEVMLCLFDRFPKAGDFDTLTFTQPPHQQCFSAAASVAADHFETVYKRVHEDGSEKDDNRSEPLEKRMWTPNSPDPVFVWGNDSEIRTLLFPAWSSDIFNTIKYGMKDLGYKFDDEFPSAALSAIQLNSSVYHMPIYVDIPFDASMIRGPPGPPPSDIPRTFKLLDVKGWTLDSDSSLEDDTPEQYSSRTMATLSTSVAGGAITRLTPMAHPLRLPQPHFRLNRYAPKTTRQASTESSSSASSRDGDLATVPKVTISVRPWGQAIGTAIPTGTKIPQDLIFSVSCTADQGASYRLKCLRVTIALGDTSDAPTTYYLTSNYRGPGATMLANLRLCPRVKFDDSGATVNVLLIPRSKTGLVPVQSVEDMSFVLPMVEINSYDKKVDLKLAYGAEYDSTHVEGNFTVNLAPK